MVVVGDHAEPVAAIAFVPDGSGLASASKDGRVRVWDLAGGPGLELSRHDGPALGVALSPAGDAFASSGGDGTIRIGRFDGRSIAEWGPFEAPVAAVTFLSGGQYVAAAIGNRLDASEAGSLRLYRTRDGSEVRRIPEPQGVWSLAAAPDSKRLAWIGGARRVTTWEITSPDRKTLPPLKLSSALAMSSDGRLVAAGDDRLVRVWDVDRQEEMAHLRGHQGRVTALAFAPDNRTLISGGGDRSVVVWDLDTQHERSKVDWDIGWVTAVAISRDGLLVAAAGERGRMVVWDRE
jgi:WD40 repeat protein